MKTLCILVAATLALALIPPSASRGKTEQVDIPYPDLLKMVESTTCQDRKTWGGKCEPEPLKVHDSAGGRELTVNCPGCMEALSVRGERLSGRLKVTGPGGESEAGFRTTAPSAAELAEHVVKPLGDYYTYHFFMKAARPRGLATDGKGNLLVTDFGTGQNDGRVWKISLDELNKQPQLLQPAEGTELVSGMPSVKIDTTFQGQPIKSVVGLSSVRADGSGLVALTNRIIAHGEKDPLAGLHGIPIASVLRINPAAGRKPSVPMGRALQPSRSAQFSVLSSLGEFEERFNPDKRGIESDPFDLARVNTRTNEANLYAVFEELPNQSYDPRQPESFQNRPQRDAVPSGVAFGPDGALYVALFAGYPFPKGGAAVYRLTDKNGDGSALDPGEQSVAVSGLTCAIGVAFDARGRMYTSEYSLDFMKNAPGRICLIRDGKCAVTITDKVVSPTGIVAIGDYIYFSQEFMGLVGRLPLPRPDK